MYMGECVYEGHSRGEQSPILANFNLDYMNWLSVLVEARHAGPRAAIPSSLHPGLLRADSSLVTVLWAKALVWSLI